MKTQKVNIQTKLYNLSFCITHDDKKPLIRKEFVDNPLLNIFHPKQFNPVVEDLMDKVVIRRSIPLDDGLATLDAIRDKVPYMSKYIEACKSELKRYINMV